jgi:hypothetical protein
MKIFHKYYKQSRKRQYSATILLIIIVFQIIFFTFPLIPNKLSSNRENGQSTPKSSSIHPISADNFNYYKQIVIDHTQVYGSDNLIDYPVLLSIFDADLHNDVQPDGDDIAFANNYTWLDYEIEQFNQNYNGSHAQLIAWVRIPLLSPLKDTIIRMYYGCPFMSSQENPSKVWDANYSAVWHMSESPDDETVDGMKDSTINGNDGTPQGFQDAGGGSTNATGIIDGAVEFDGSVVFGDYITIPSPINTDPSIELTVSVWVNATALSSGEIITRGDTYGIRLWLGGRILFYKYDGSTWQNMAPTIDIVNISDNTYHYIVAGQNSTGMFLYLDGVRVDANTNIDPFIYNQGNTVEIGRHGNGHTDVNFTGVIDEARISNTARSEAWIATEYANQNDPLGFYTIGNEMNVYIPSVFDFKYFKEIAIDHTQVSGSSALINFPVLISIFDSELHNETQSDGDDIAFNNGTSWLFHEIELFDQNYNSSHAQLIAWICIPNLSPSEDTIIRMYYGNSTMARQGNPYGVWDSDFLGVWHLKESGTGAMNEYFDSSHYGNHGQGGEGNASFIPTRTTGKIGSGQDFNNLDGYYDLIDCGDDPLWDLEGYGITLEAWIQHDITPNTHVYGIMNHKGWFDGYSLLINYGGGSVIKPVFDLPGDTHQLVGANDVTGGSWHHIVATYDGSLMRIYVDGVQDPNTLVKSNAIEPSSSEKGFWIGHGDQPKDRPWSAEWEGQIDEVRISDVARSGDWILTEYNNQYDPNNFYSISTFTRVVDEKPSNTEFFNYFKTIEVDHRRISGTGSYNNFPLLVSIFDKDLRYDVQSDGDDIAFSLGSMWLDHEIEVFNKNYNSTHAQLIAWVRIPDLSTSLNSYIRMYYGNSTMSSRQNKNEVWASVYKGVWHLNEDPSSSPPQMKDSSTPYSNGSTSGVMTLSDQVNGMIDGSLDFDGINDYVDFSNPSELQVTGDLTIQAWFKADIAIANDYLIAKWGGAGQRGWCINFESDIAISPDGWVKFSFSTDGTNIYEIGRVQVQVGQWYQVVGVFKPNEYAKFFLNGVQVGLRTTGIPPNLNNPSVSARLARRSDTDTNYFDGIIDEARVCNIARSNGWILTEYENQFRLHSFYSIGEEQLAKDILLGGVQVNTIDLYGNLIPNVNITMYFNTQLIRSGISDTNGSVYFSEIPYGDYNFTASMTSDIGNHIEIVNVTSQSILINSTFQIVNLSCNVGTNFFEVEDVDGIPLDSGWILVGNSSNVLRNCTIDAFGKTKFWWVNSVPYDYNYTIYYQDESYNPSIIELSSGTINTANSTIQVQVELTTVEFTVFTIASDEPVSGVKIKLRFDDILGASIVNLTTDQNGIATLRWLTSSLLGGNYSLQLEFYDQNMYFNNTNGGPATVEEYSFIVSGKSSLEFKIPVSLADFQTELVSLNPSEDIIVSWGSEVLLRLLFNVTKAGGSTELLGPVYADLISYRILLAGSTVFVGTFNKEINNSGKHQVKLETIALNSGTSYIIIISGQKSGYSLPSDLILQLSITKNDLVLNQSNNDDSPQSVYWLESADLSVESYGVVSEEFVIQENIFQDENHNFAFNLPDLENHWNLSRAIFNIYNISWNVEENDINITIIDPYGHYYMFHATNHSGKNYALGQWRGIVIDLNKNSPTQNNSFEFTIGGSFSGTVDVIADACFIRDHVQTNYFMFNVSDSIIVATEAEGWAIKEVEFELINCHENGMGNLINPLTDAHLNITANDGFKYSLDAGYINGTGSLDITDRIIYPISGGFLFTVESTLDIMFDVIIHVAFTQEFCRNIHLEEFNSSLTRMNVNNGGFIQISVIENSWLEQNAELNVNGITNGISYFLPSELAMSISIGGQIFSIVDLSRGYGTFSLTGFDKDLTYSAIITTNQQVDFSLEFHLQYSRTVNYEVVGTVSYVILQAPSIQGTVPYDSNLGHYLQTIDTSLMDADDYIIRFTVFKDHYFSTMKDLQINVLSRLTLINGSSEFLRKVEEIYVEDPFNFTLFYTDQLLGLNITDLETQYYIWEKYDEEGNILTNGQGTLLSNLDGSYILDFDTKTRPVGNYLMIVTLDKANYDYKNAMIFLTIHKRYFTYTLGDNFEGTTLNVIKGKSLPIPITLTDPTKGNTPLTNTTILLVVNGVEYAFQELGNGSYIFNFPTSNIDAFFSSEILMGKIIIEKNNYFSQELQITIVVEMEQIFPGFPTFYFLLIIIAIAASLGSITVYRVYKKAKIPIFVKKVRAIRKIIDANKTISNNLLYGQKEVFVGELVKERWDELGISLNDVLGVNITKKRKPSRKETASLAMKREHDLKPLGLILMKWNERIGTEIITKYPEDAKISSKTLMQIYSTHEYSGEKGVITLMEGNLNIVSYYSGPEIGYYLILILNFEDDPDAYEIGLVDALQTILLNLEDEAYEHVIPAIFHRLSLYPTFNDEQILLNTYQNEVKSRILNFLRDDGLILKSELSIWLKDKYLEAFIDLDTILKDLMKMEIIKQISIKGVPSEVILLTNDIIMLRTPPLTLIKNVSKEGLPPSLTGQFMNDLQKYFTNYRPTEEDNLALAKVLMSPPVYETIRLLRSTVATQNEFEKLKKKGVDDIYSVLKVLWDSQMIRVYHDKNNVEYYALLTDFYIDTIFPKYLLNAIKASYEQKSKANKILIESLKALEEYYYGMKKQTKTE